MNKSKLLLQVLTISLFLILIGCNPHHSQLQRLNHLDSLMEKHPKEVYDTLCNMAPAISKANVDKNKMKYRVLMAKAQNKLFVEMPSVTSFQEVVDYYDKKGTPNERMEAHYLMGCIYRDKKEAPMAMQCYQEAVECADTLSKDCDYVTLFSIYGQMADVFRKQYLFNEALKAEKDYSHYALKAGNIFEHIVGLEKMASLYCCLKDTAKAIKQVKEAVTLYRKYGMMEAAADAYGLLIHIYVVKRQYIIANHYIPIFEHESGLFDSQGNITSSRGYYNYAKGLYYLGVNKLDSAELCFRKLAKYGAHFEANKGLMLVSQKRNKPEKIPQYMELCERAMDSILENKQTIAVKQAASMYNYNRIQATADRMLLEKVRTEKEVIALLLSVFALCLLIAYLYKRYKKKMSLKQLEMDQKAKEYQNSMENFQESRIKEASELKDKMDKLQAQLQNYKMQYDKIMLSEKNVVVEDEEIYLVFKKMAKGLRTVPMPSAKEWKMLEILVAEKFPVFFGKICDNKVGKKLSLQEWRVCLLTRLHFSNSEIVNILNSTPSSISNAKQMVNHKIFDDNRAGTLYKNMLTIL